MQGTGDHTGVGDPGPVALTLEPGEAAYTVLLWRNTVTSAAPCLGTTGRLFTTAWQQDDTEKTSQRP